MSILNKIKVRIIIVTLQLANTIVKNEKKSILYHFKWVAAFSFREMAITKNQTPLSSDKCRLKYVEYKANAPYPGSLITQLTAYETIFLLCI